MKKIIIISIVIVIIISFLGVIFIRNKFISNQQIIEEIPTPTIMLPTISDSIKVDLIPKQENKIVMIKISGLSPDIESVEYELTYNTSSGLPRGVLGKIITSGKNEINRDDIVLGTCSSGKCVYDTGVNSVLLSLKFNSAEGTKVFQNNYSF